MHSSCRNNFAFVGSQFRCKQRDLSGATLTQSQYAAIYRKRQTTLSAWATARWAESALNVHCRDVYNSTYKVLLAPTGSNTQKYSLEVPTSKGRIGWAGWKLTWVTASRLSLVPRSSLSQLNSLLSPVANERAAWEGLNSQILRVPLLKPTAKNLPDGLNAAACGRTHRVFTAKLHGICKRCLEFNEARQTRQKDKSRRCYYKE